MSLNVSNVLPCFARNCRSMGFDRSMIEPYAPSPPTPEPEKKTFAPKHEFGRHAHDNSNDDVAAAVIISLLLLLPLPTPAASHVRVFPGQKHTHLEWSSAFSTSLHTALFSVSDSDKYLDRRGLRSMFARFIFF